MSLARKEQGRRGNGEGSITEVRRLANGDVVYRWSIWATLITGERKRLKGTYTGRSVQLARQAMWDAKKEQETSARGVARDHTMAMLLAEWMENDRQNAGISPRTLQIQEDLIRLHLLPRLGTWKVAALTADLLEGYHLGLLRETTLGRSRQQIQVILRQVLNYAVRKGYLAFNPIGSVKVPQRQEKRKAAKAKEIKAWTPAQAGQLERAALEEGSMLSLSIAFGLRTGMRRGEIFGLKWREVNLDEGTLRVEEVLSTHGDLSRSITEPKTISSRRTLKLSQAALTILRRAQDLQQRNQKPDQPMPEYVFTTRQGEMQHPNNTHRRLQLLVAAAGLPYLPFHSLRHTFVSIAAHQGWSIKQVSVYIGHANTVVTQLIYLHLWPEDQKAIELYLG